MTVQHSPGDAMSQDIAQEESEDKPVGDWQLAFNLIERTSGRLRAYQNAFAWIGREINGIIGVLRQENAELQSRLSTLERKLEISDAIARKAIASLESSNLHCISLTQRIRRLEVDLGAAQLNILKQADQISGLCALTFKTHYLVGDDLVGIAPPIEHCEQVVGSAEGALGGREDVGYLPQVPRFGSDSLKVEGDVYRQVGAIRTLSEAPDHEYADPRKLPADQM